MPEVRGPCGAATAPNGEGRRLDCCSVGRMGQLPVDHLSVTAHLGRLSSSQSNYSKNCPKNCPRNYPKDYSKNYFNNCSIIIKGDTERDELILMGYGNNIKQSKGGLNTIMFNKLVQAHSSISEVIVTLVIVIVIVTYMVEI